MNLEKEAMAYGYMTIVVLKVKYSHYFLFLACIMLLDLHKWVDNQ